MRLALAVICALSLAACGEDGETFDDPGGSGGGIGGSGGAGGIGGTGGSGGSSEPTAWVECDDGDGECATFDVPLDWDAPDGEQLPFFVRRFPARGASKGQLWLLEGGPGVAGWSMYELQPYFERIAPGFDVYVPDYRGVGHSAWLGCEGQPGDVVRAGCRADLLEKWGDKLAHFSTSDAARDIGHTIEQVRQPGEAVYVYGTSYGTFVGNRYLTLFPDQPDAVVLDSVCPASGCDVRMDRNFTLVAQHVFADLCAQDALCSSKLGADPWAHALSVLDAVGQGHCSELFGPQSRMFLEAAIAYTVTNPETLAAATAAIYRAERCEAGDVAAVQELVSTLFGGAGGFAAEAPAPSGQMSEYLGNHIVFSEFWPEGLDLAAAEAELDELPVRLGALTGRASDRERWTWPFYDTPDGLMRWADTDAPVLLLDGDLDAQTHLNGLADVEQSFTAQWQHFVQVPMGGHGTIFWSGPGARNPRMPCGMELIEAFFANPRGALDTTCAQTAPAADFAGDPAIARMLFGTSDFWEDATSAAQAIPPLPTARQLKALDAVRRLVRETHR